jgi:cell division protein FtsZ
LGENITKELGAGTNPLVGRKVAVEDSEYIADTLRGADMVFLTCGTGVATVVVSMAIEN